MSFSAASTCTLKTCSDLLGSIPAKNYIPTTNHVTEVLQRWLQRPKNSNVPRRVLTHRAEAAFDKESEFLWLNNGKWFLPAPSKADTAAWKFSGRVVAWCSQATNCHCRSSIVSFSRLSMFKFCMPYRL